MSRKRVQKKHVAVNSLVLLMVLIFIGCASAYAEQDVIDKTARPMKKIIGEEKSTPPQGTKYFYDPTGMTDPFKSFITEQEEVAEKQRRKPKTYLETLDISQLELIAIIAGPLGNYAMVRDSKGTGYVITKGTAIGTEGGVVDKITEREVVIKEEFKDFRGVTRQKEITKKLNPPTGKGT
jgi:Tfp pilus assembly protein PilP